MDKYTRLALVTAFVVFVFVSGCATTDSANTDLAANVADAASEGGQVIRECRYAKATGTKMRTRICYTQATWAAIDAANEEEQDTDDFFRRAREGSSAANNADVPPVGGG